MFYFITTARFVNTFYYENFSFKPGGKIRINKAREGSRSARTVTLAIMQETGFKTYPNTLEFL